MTDPKLTITAKLNKMKFSTALVAVAAIAGGSSAFQTPSRTVVNRAVNGHSASALMAATMDGTAAVAAVNGQVNGKRKKTKQVSQLQ